jgi:4-hydroxybenzoate polyprenyltransferase
MRPLAYRPVRRRRHRELFVVAIVLFVLGAFVLGDGLAGLAVFASVLAFFFAIINRLSGEDTAAAERMNMMGGFGG